MDEARAKDLDETRRLLYMALVFHRTDQYELVGTLVNGLVHHQQVEEDADQVIDWVLDALAGHGAGLEWVRDQINRVTDQLR